MYHLVIFAAQTNPSLVHRSIDVEYGYGIDARTLGPSMIKHVLEKVGFNVQIINFVHTANEQTLREIFKKYVTSDTVVGISTTFITANHGIKDTLFTKILFEKRNQIGFKILLGGTFPAAISDIYKPDYVISGYAENKVIDLFNSIFNKGISRKVYNWDINTCDHKWSDNDFIQPGETLPLENNRGCIFKCKFCRYELTGKKKGEYLRNMDLIRAELVDNYDKHGTTNYMLTDDTFNDDLYKLGLWNDMISSLPFKIQYSSYARLDLFHRFPQSARDVCDTGFRGAMFGIESFDPRAAKAIGKAWSAKHAKEFIPVIYNDIFKKNVYMQINFIIGLPYETIHSINNTMTWLEENRHNYHRAQLNPLTLQPNKVGQEAATSEFDREYQKYGYQFLNADSENDVRRNFWTSPTMNAHKAFTIAQEWFEKHKDQIKSGVWEAFTYLNFTSLDQIFEKSEEEIVNNPEFRFKKNQFYKNYFTDVLK
jgi:radical SAM superfamily enzyme YgiQ (UPF0313 family)